jgi:putative transposase
MTGGIWDIFNRKIQVPGIVKYIEEQQEHHKKVSFREEYLEFLKENDIEFDKRYIFEPIE